MGIEPGISRQGEIGLKDATRYRGLQFCRMNLYAHTTPLSAQIAEWYVHNDLSTAEDARGWRVPGQGRARPGRGKRQGRVGGAGSDRPLRAPLRDSGGRNAASPYLATSAISWQPQGPQADAGATGAPTAAAAACVMRRAGLQRSQPRVRRATRAGGSAGGGSSGACEARVLVERSVTGAAAEEAQRR